MNTRSVSGDGGTSSGSNIGPAISLPEMEDLVEDSFPTSGSESAGKDYFFQFPNTADVFKNVYARLDPLKDARVKEQAIYFILSFQKILSAKVRGEPKANLLPIASLSELEDHSALLEWGFKDFKIGFSFESDPDNSTWYLVSNKNLNEIAVSGKLDRKFLGEVIDSAISFALSNS